MLELYTFTISHFCEKARWALDRAQLSYRERILIPGAHLVTTRRLASKSTVPILVHDGRRIQGSTPIYDYVDTELAPGALSRGHAEDDAARSLEAQIDQAIGVCGRRIAYSGKKSDAAAIARLWCQAGPVWARAFYWIAFPVVMSKVQRMYKCDDDAALRSAFSEVDRALDELDARLQRQPYLSGEHPGRADFALASLLAPLRFPSEHPAPWSYVPETLQELGRRYAERPTLRHVQTMYRLHRHVGAPYRLTGRGPVYDGRTPAHLESASANRGS
jgi:glutathione S-transferase